MAGVQRPVRVQDREGNHKVEVENKISLMLESRLHPEPLEDVDPHGLDGAMSQEIPSFPLVGDLTGRREAVDNRKIKNAPHAGGAQKDVDESCWKSNQRTFT